VKVLSTNGDMSRISLLWVDPSNPVLKYQKSKYKEYVR